MTTLTLPTTMHQATGWDRTAILALGTAGCALSYDALQQMAVAIHVRGLLTYLFPLVIDGFIAYGVRALLVLHEAPFRARLYVSSRRVGRPASAELDQLIAIGRQIDGKQTRESVAAAIRADGHTVSDKRLTQVMAALKAERATARPRELRDH